MYAQGASVEDCAAACDADETCVAFDYSTEDEMCNAFKADTLGPYVGNGTSGWSCYTILQIPDNCPLSVFQDTVDNFTMLNNCNQALDQIRSTFEEGHGQYIKQDNPGYCVRTTDNEYDFANLSTMIQSSGSVYECALACNADEDCVAFDYERASGNCDSYKQDTLAAYQGNGNENFECYTRISMPEYCPYEMFQGTVDVIVNIQQVLYDIQTQVDTL